MLLMFLLGRGNYGFLVNFEFIAEEIVRTLVGSLGLVMAVPLTTAIAILFALRAVSLTPTLPKFAMKIALIMQRMNANLGRVPAVGRAGGVGATFRLVRRIENTRSASER
jgi:hypothetical protein